MGLQQLIHCRLAAPTTTTARPDRGTSKIETTGSATTSSSCRVTAAVLTILACITLALSY